MKSDLQTTNVKIDRCANIQENGNDVKSVCQKLRLQMSCKGIFRRN